MLKCFVQKCKIQYSEEPTLANKLLRSLHDIIAIITRCTYIYEVIVRFCNQRAYQRKANESPAFRAFGGALTWEKLEHQVHDSATANLCSERL